MQDVVQAACAHAELRCNFPLGKVWIVREHTQDSEARVVRIFGGFGLQLSTALPFGAAAGQATARICAIADPIWMLC